MAIDPQERTTREKAVRRGLILKAARALFLERGVDAATMDEIAERTELAKATLYLYFRRKEDLFVALLQEGLDELNGRLREAAAGQGTAPDRLRAFGRAYVGFYREQPAFFRLLSHFNNAHDRCSEEVVAPCEERMIEGVHICAGIVADGMTEGSLSAHLPAVEVAAMFWASAHGLMRLLSYRTCRDCLGLDPALDVISAVQDSWELILRGLLVRT